MIQAISNEKKSYDETDYENYFEDRQHVCNGSEQHPEFTKQHNLTKSKDKTLKNDLKLSGFPSEIIVKADEVFSQMNSGCKRGDRKNQQMFFCAHTAYNILRIPIDPADIASMCGIAPSEISKAFSMCSPSKTGYQAPSVNWEPKDYLKFYYQKIINLDIMEFDENVLHQIEKICNEIMENDEKLEDEKPQTVAAAIIVYYLQINGYAVDVNKYTEIFGRSQMTIQKIKNKVAEAYNS